jgi:ribonuclease P/MRP protein subunit POP8
MDARTKSSHRTDRDDHKEVSFTLRATPYTYLHLSVTDITQPVPRAPLDAITARTYLTSALSQYLGLTGTAIPIDMLKVADQDAWIRVPRQDASAVAAAVGQWANAQVGVSLKIEGRGEWLGGVRTGGETRRDELFSLEGPQQART